MKNLFLILPLLSLAIGCQTVQQNVTPANSEKIVCEGAKWAATYKPEYRAPMIATAQVIKGLARTGDYDPAKLAAACQLLPIQELASTNGSMIVASFIVIWDFATSSLWTLDSTNAVAQWIDAISDGLMCADTGQPMLATGVFSPSSPTKSPLFVQGATFYKDAAGKYRWRLEANNGRITVSSSQGFTTRRYCKQNYHRLFGQPGPWPTFDAP